MQMKKKRKISVLSVVFTLILFIGVLCVCSARWYIEVYGDVGFDAVLYTLFSNIDGAETGLVWNYVFNALLKAVLITALISAVLFAVTSKKLFMQVGKKEFCVYPFPKWLSAVFAVIISVVLTVNAAISSNLDVYLSYMLSPSSNFIKENYIDPKSVDIKFPSQKRNLIVIYLESMETSFTSAEYSGGNDVNPIPELCALAEKNLNFSQNSTVGGFTSLSGSGWTMAALVAINCGVPLKLPFSIDGNEYGKEHFLPNITSLSDILHKNGYYQAFMCGSPASFGGREAFYNEHGIDDIFDYNTADDDGIIPEGYAVWWGMEDLHLFEYAKQKLTEISKENKPFAFSMLTADTHHIGGYVCSLCKDQFPEQYENVFACSSRQVNEFVDWIQNQEFYKNTTVVICGDHPSMDGEYVYNNIPENYKRKVYNCFINSAVDTKSTKNREFSSFDMFPTILASIGCEMSSARLGLGTDMFSQSLTLSEQMGNDVIDTELNKKSDYYDKEFLGLNLK